MCCSTCKIRHVQPSCGTSPDLQNSRRAALCLTRHFTALNCARRLHRFTAFSLKISAACVRSPNPVSPLNRGIGSLEVVNAADQALRRGRRHFFPTIRRANREGRRRPQSALLATTAPPSSATTVSRTRFRCCCAVCAMVCVWLRRRYGPSQSLAACPTTEPAARSCHAEGRSETLAGRHRGAAAARAGDDTAAPTP